MEPPTSCPLAVIPSKFDISIDGGSGVRPTSVKLLICSSCASMKEISAAISLLLIFALLIKGDWSDC
jgi:hypothetical protein